MAMIHFVSLDAQIRRAVENKQYNEEEIIQLNSKIKADERVKKKVFLVTMIILTAVLLVGGGIIYGTRIGFPDALPLLLLNMLVIAVVGPVSWYASTGRMMKQWNDLMRLYYPAVYMDNEYGKVGRSDEEPQKPKSVTKPKTKINGKSVLKKVYYIITIILSVLIMILFVIAAVSPSNSRHTSADISGTCASVLIAVIAAGSLILSVKGLRQNSYIPGIILEKAGILFAGIGLIVFITGLFSQGKMLQALLISVPAFIIGAVCFISGVKVLNRKREQE